ncbi:DUF3068 domain-containing protein [Aeromicrobium sp.]|uniref:DUF3068 domain-containing protein n=1 Tax=Aeromicrobium sp. TaxID=1871063 RepID=UPI003D6B65DF
MRKLGTVALFFGAFLLALAALTRFYMYDRLAVAPFNNTSTSISETKAGADAEYLDIKKLEVVSGPLKSTRIVSGDVKQGKAVSKDLRQDVVVWHTYSCTGKPDFDCSAGKTPLSGTTDLVAFDRTSGAAVTWAGATSESGGEKTEPAGFEGQYFKFPFDTQKKSYKFWDGTIDRATTVEYVGEGEIDGLGVYEFRQTIEPTKSGTIDVPGDLVDENAATVTADRMYSNVRTFSVEPTTGVILVGGEQQDSFLAVDGERRLTTTKATLEYTDETTQGFVDEYESKALLLGLVKSTIPLVGLVLGVLLIGLGLLSRRGRRSRRSDGDQQRTPVGAGVG